MMLPQEKSDTNAVSVSFCKSQGSITRVFLHQSTSSSSSPTSRFIYRDICNTIIKPFISSDAHDSLLSDSNDSIKYFKWDCLFGELSCHMPTCHTFERR